MSVNEDKLTSGVTGAPSTWNTQCCEIVLVSGADSFAQSSAFTALPLAFLRYEIILGTEGLADNQERMLFWFSGGSVGQDLILAYLRQVSGELRWRFRVFESSLSSATIYTATSPLALNTPYRLEFKWDTVSDVWEIRQNSTTLFNGVLTSTPAATPVVKVGIGSWALDSGTVTYYLDNIAVTDDTWIGAESGAAPTYNVAKLSPANRIAVVSM